MARKLFSAFNGAMPTTAGPAKVTTGTAIKTMMQLAPVANGGIEIIEWGISFDGSAAATPGICELTETGTVFATVTAYVAADITKFNGLADATRCTLGTSASGYTGSAEGTVTATRNGDYQLLPPTAPYIKQFPLETGFAGLASQSVRVRVTFGTAINALCYALWTE